MTANRDYLIGRQVLLCQQFVHSLRKLLTHGDVSFAQRLEGNCGLLAEIQQLLMQAGRVWQCQAAVQSWLAVIETDQRAINGVETGAGNESNEIGRRCHGWLVCYSAPSCRWAS